MAPEYSNKHSAAAPPRRLPAWFRQAVPQGRSMHPHPGRLLKDLALHTVCEGAKCPNRAACWHDGAAAFMILGGACTRNCRFCAVPHAAPLPPPDSGEPERVADAAAKLRLKHVVVTSVTRDDLPDGGAAHFAATIAALRRSLPGTAVEVLIPDFGGNAAALDVVLAAQPDVLNHNLETVERLQAVVRPQAGYARSLEVLRRAAEHGGSAVKSGLMLGMGETDEEVRRTLNDLRTAGVELLTLGQYLAPSQKHHPVAAYVPPEKFAAWGRTAWGMGFRSVAAAPQVRSSYHPGELLQGAAGAE